MKTFENCISCYSKHEWTEKDIESSGQISFYKAVCESCLKRLRNNEFDDDWSMKMMGRIKTFLNNSPNL